MGGRAIPGRRRPRPGGDEAARLRVVWATPGRWDDLERLFGERGACAGCWCMFWRLRRSEWEAGKGDGNRRALERLVAGGARPGTLGYLDREPVAWCAIAPRDEYSYLARARVLKPLDDTPVWSISCLFVDRHHRRRGLATRMLDETARMSARRGARTVEGYPVLPSSEAMPAAFIWNGTLSSFEAAGFREVARPSPTRPIVRRALTPAG